jgi:glyoxylase-like metal-dependent hydrolase (beta-lactamase superfamily II)
MRRANQMWVDRPDRLVLVIACLVAAAIGRPCDAGAGEPPGTRVNIVRGAANGVAVERNGHRLVIYGDPQDRWQTADTVLFTDSRRDVVWAGRALADAGARCVVPVAEAERFTNAERFWTDFWDKRFHDYAQQSTKAPTVSMRVDRAVREGDVIEFEGLSIRVLDTGGYTPGAVSYFMEADGVKYGFVGDLIWGDGQLFDLYSLQDAVDEAKIGGYHGYAGRMGQLIESLRKVAAERPDMLVPARGPIIEKPELAIERLIERLQPAYRNYLSINAGRWYFKERYEVLASRVLGDNSKVDWMPYAKRIEKTPPDWIVPIDNSRLLLSQDRSGFMIDCGSRAIFDRVQKLHEAGRLTSIEGLFITHYHDDHTDWVNEFLDRHGCPAYVTPVMEDVLRRPGAYRLPAMTAKPITRLKVVPDGYRMRWKEFALTFYDFPGQTVYHDALLVEKDDGEKIFFIGDSFTPSGIDDYCLQNRNVLHDGMGYLYCLDHLKNKVSPEALLINEHVVELFRFDRDQIGHMRKTLEQRTAILAELFPWDDANYGIDEQWARIYPYGQECAPGRQATISVKLLNHSAKRTTFTVRLNVPAGFESEPAMRTVTSDPRQEAEARFQLRVPNLPSGSIRAVTVDVQFGPWDLRQWCEGLIRITHPEQVETHILSRNSPVQRDRRTQDLWVIRHSCATVLWAGLPAVTTQHAPPPVHHRRPAPIERLALGVAGDTTGILPVNNSPFAHERDNVQWSSIGQIVLKMEDRLCRRRADKGQEELTTHLVSDRMSARCTARECSAKRCGCWQ